MCADSSGGEVPSVINMIQKNRKIFFIFGSIGIIGGFMFVGISPVKYEAVAVIELQRVFVNETTKAVETPGMLAMRLSMPSTYESKVIEACGLEKNDGETMASLVNTKLRKNMPETIEMHVKRNTPELAERCTRAVFESVQMQEKLMVRPMLDNLRRDLIKAEGRLANRKKQVLLLTQKCNKDIQAIIYFAMRDEENALLAQIEKLNVAINGITENGAKLQVPIWTYSKPVSSRNFSSLIVGLLGGLLMGWFYTRIKNLRS